MKRSSERILTTHVGSLPRPAGIVAILSEKDAGRAYDRARFEREIARSVADVVERQARLGIDIVNDGEHSKSSFAAYGQTRLAGLREVSKPLTYKGPTRDSLAFPDVYREAAVMNGARRAGDPDQRRRRTLAAVCAAPVSYAGQAEVAFDVACLGEALRGQNVEDAFVTAISPTNLELYHPDEYYRSDDDYLEALADAMNVEYRAIVDAGFILQIDDPRLATHYNRTPGASLAECRSFMASRVEAVNHALRGVPREKVRFHTCYSVNVAPRVHDWELRHYLDLMLRVRAQAFTFEAANPRHEHEWIVWKEAKLPDDIVLMPGVVSHCVHLVEHPELVAQRIERYAAIVGRENVVASNDCGFATSAAGDEVHPDVAWAKLAAMVEGARIATARLWGRQARSHG